MIRYAMLAVLCLALALTACKEEGPAERAEEQVEEQTEEKAEQLEEKAEAVEERAEEMEVEAHEEAAEAKAEQLEEKAEAIEEAGEELEIEKLELKADAPKDSKVGDAVVGEGVMVQGPGLVVTVAEATETDPEDLEAARKEAEMYSPEDVETEELEDGFALTFENEGSMGKNYFVNVRRTLGDKTVWCTTTASQEEQQANALAFCKSLRR